MTHLFELPDCSTLRQVRSGRFTGLLLTGLLLALAAPVVAEAQIAWPSTPVAVALTCS